MPNEIAIQYYKTEFGELILGSFQNQLCLCDWRYRKMRDSVDNRIKTGLKADFVEKRADILDQTKQQLNEYITAKRKSFDLPLLLVGTDFQKKVWQELIKIPFGQTASYLQLSENLGNKLAIRAVASANGANALSIIVPCHRIIGSKGELVGYAGGLAAKQKLLTLENEKFGQKISHQMSIDFSS
jgi:methylated-DNA-[protein]-cysteine S-methyltransferase